MDHFIDIKIPKLGFFVDKNSQNDQTPFPKVGRKTPGMVIQRDLPFLLTNPPNLRKQYMSYET